MNECLFKTDLAGTYTFAFYSTENGVAKPPPRSVSVILSISPDYKHLKSGKPHAFVLPPNGNMYFTFDVEPGTAMFFRTNTNESTTSDVKLAGGTIP